MANMQMPIQGTELGVQPQNNRDQATTQQQMQNSVTGRIYGDLGG